MKENEKQKCLENSLYNGKSFWENNLFPLWIDIVYDLNMTLSSYRMHRIYLAATMGYGLGSDDPEELSYYNKIRKDMEDMKKDSVKKGISLSFEISQENDKWI